MSVIRYDDMKYVKFKQNYQLVTTMSNIHCTATYMNSLKFYSYVVTRMEQNKGR